MKKKKIRLLVLTLCSFDFKQYFTWCMALFRSSTNFHSISFHVRFRSFFFLFFFIARALVVLLWFARWICIRSGFDGLCFSFLSFSNKLARMFDMYVVFSVSNLLFKKEWKFFSFFFLFFFAFLITPLQNALNTLYSISCDKK